MDCSPAKKVEEDLFVESFNESLTEKERQTLLGIALKESLEEQPNTYPSNLPCGGTDARLSTRECNVPPRKELLGGAGCWYPQYRGILFGHSFIRHLHDHLGAGSGTLAAGLKVNHIVQSIQPICKPDARLQDLVEYASNISEWHESPPSFLIIELGTHDLCNGMPAKALARDFVDLARIILDKSSVRHVSFCLILQRSSDLRVLSQSDFEEASTKFNEEMKDATGPHRDMRYHRHKGFNSPVDEGIWSCDGVHPNTEYGLKRYIASIRMAVFEAIIFLKKEDNP